MNSKICNICKKEKPLNKYYKTKKVNSKGNKYDYYYPYCKECNIQKSKKWNKENPEKHCNAVKKQYKNNNHGYREKLHEYCNQREKENGYMREWRRNNKEKIKTYNKLRNIKNHDITDEEWNECLNFFNYSCAYCGMTMKEHKEKYNKSLHKEHIVHDGLNDITNCVPSCQGCNSMKRKRDLIEFYNYKYNDKFTEDMLAKIYEWLEN